jgi:protein TonB
MSPTAYQEEVTIEERPSRPPTARNAVPLPIYARPLFADSLLESKRNVNRRRGWTTILSLAIQGVLVCMAILVPLIYTEALPKQQLLTLLVAPPPPPPPPPPAAPEVVKSVRVETEMIGGQLRTPTRIPEKIAMIREEQPPPEVASGGVIGGVPGGIPGGQLGGVLGGIIGSSSNLNVIPKAPKPESTRIRVSQGVSIGRLITKVEPLYPKLARDARVQGQVVLAAIISKDGTIQDLHVLSGHPMLVPAALDAVRQWRYKPYLLNGEPVEVETTVTVNFTLTG